MSRSIGRLAGQEGGGYLLVRPSEGADMTDGERITPNRRIPKTDEGWQP